MMNLLLFMGLAVGILVGAAMVLWSYITFLESRARAECEKQQHTFRLATQDVGLELVNDAKWLVGHDASGAELLRQVGRNIVAKGHSDIEKIARQKLAKREMTS